ncbi:AraC family transcriptional regulator [Paraglaciecola aquimarina]|uniref:AraC family transcriptional regulator n=1 Tax=Paraglaciecola algarum TaxID=3050085 RepID=A0ABS9DA51_9ALTE|nr:helix-turn-helix domain-containing protein [Paraglaciecola sp. G1-23]MCF2949624.1 AraC family transcriptional regulator [Paraglaciecola sp. G1-23]
MKSQRVYCEPFCIEKSHLFEIHKVVYKEQDTYTCFMHFHEVHEFIFFESITGQYFYSQGESVLEDNDIVFIPALETHNFDCADGEKSWYIIQFLPELFEHKDFLGVRELFNQALHLRLQPEHIAVIQQQLEWLHSCYLKDPHSALSLSLLKTLILWVAEFSYSVDLSHNQPIAKSQGFKKLQPIIDLFRHNPSVDLSLNQAAEKCYLSPAYFSRLFKSVFRCNYSEYNLKHKLYSAARMISQTEKSITEISYELHFSSPSHFIAQFRKQFSVTPKKYRNQILLNGG